MNRRIISISAACALLAGAGVARADKVPLTQCPDPVQRAIKQQSQGETLEDVDRHTKDGQTVYDAEFKREGINRHVTFAADGTVLPERHAADLLPKRSSLMVSDLPAAVQKTIKEQRGGREIGDIRQETRDGRAVYSVEFKEKGPDSHIYIANDGSMVVSNNKESIGERVREKIGLGEKNTVALDQTPAAVQKTIRDNCDVGSLKPIKRVMHDGRAEYKVEYEKDGKNLRMTVNEDGTVLKDNR